MADNYANLQDLFEVTKFYQISKKSLSLHDHGNEADTIKLQQSFMVNEIKFSSRLNQDFQTAVLDSTDPQLYLDALLNDYHYNQRQFVIYMVDCHFLKCNGRDFE